MEMIEKAAFILTMDDSPRTVFVSDELHITPSSTQILNHVIFKDFFIVFVLYL